MSRKPSSPFDPSGWGGSVSGPNGDGDGAQPPTAELPWTPQARRWAEIALAELFYGRCPEARAQLLMICAEVADGCDAPLARVLMDWRAAHCPPEGLHGLIRRVYRDAMLGQNATPA